MGLSAIFSLHQFDANGFKMGSGPINSVLCYEIMEVKLVVCDDTWHGDTPSAYFYNKL